MFQEFLAAADLLYLFCASLTSDLASVLQVEQADYSFVQSLNSIPKFLRLIVSMYNQVSHVSNKIYAVRPRSNSM